MSSTSIKCVIVEDEQHTARLIENYISQLEQLECIGTFVSPLELLNFKELEEVQIIYLDIQTPGMTGIDFLKLKPVKAEVVFITAYSQYAIESYELNIVDYVLKPVEFPRFIKATQKAINQINYKKIKINKLDSTSEFIHFKVDKKLVRVNVKDIIYVQSDWNYVHVFTLEKKYMILSTMKAIIKDLSSYNFVRIHKSYLINLDHFKSIEGNLVELNYEIKLQVSRNYKQDLLELLN
jgi:DNA-binding LytR/AlgR family response regulator